MPCKNTCLLVKQHLVLMQCLTRHLQQASVSMQTQREMSDESQPHAHADRQEGREIRDGKRGKRQSGKKRKGEQQERKRNIK